MTVLGLLGCGKIGTAVMTGFCSSNGWQPKHVYVSQRSAAKAERLKADFPDLVTICESNQEIIDQSDIIFIGLLPDVAKDILPQLAFPETKQVISMMATIPYDEIVSLVKLDKSSVVRTVPLPSSSRRSGPILMYPRNDLLGQILDHVGTPVIVEDEAEITKMTGITAMISFFYRTCASLQGWCVTNGVQEESSRAFVAAFFKSLAEAGFLSTESFEEMAEEAATPGGLNEQTHKALIENGCFELMLDQLDDIYTRLEGADPVPRAAKRQRQA